MSTRTTRATSLPGLGAFCCGLGIIIAATILNVAHDHLTERDIARLPFSLPLLYDAAGKFGVTLMLVTLGLAVILVGIVLNRPRRERDLDEDMSVPRRLVYYSSSGEPQEEHTNGVLVLQTRKYLAHANLSGRTGNPAQRTPKD